jgi:hypothetical protein
LPEAPGGEKCVQSIDMIGNPVTRWGVGVKGAGEGFHAVDALERLTRTANHSGRSPRWITALK